MSNISFPFVEVKYLSKKEPKRQNKYHIDKRDGEFFSSAEIKVNYQKIYH